MTVDAPVGYGRRFDERFPFGRQLSLRRGSLRSSQALLALRTLLLRALPQGDGFVARHQSVRGPRAVLVGGGCRTGASVRLDDGRKLRDVHVHVVRWARSAQYA